MIYGLLAILAVLFVMRLSGAASRWDRRIEIVPSTEERLWAGCRAGPLSQRLGLQLLVGDARYNLVCGHEAYDAPPRSSVRRARVYMAGRPFQRPADLRYEFERYGDDIKLQARLAVAVSADFPDFDLRLKTPYLDVDTTSSIQAPRHRFGEPALDGVLNFHCADPTLASRLAPALAPLLQLEHVQIVGRSGSIHFEVPRMMISFSIPHSESILFVLASIACVLEGRPLIEPVATSSRVAPCAHCGDALPSGAQGSLCEACQQLKRREMSTLELDMQLGWKRRVQDAASAPVASSDEIEGERTQMRKGIVQRAVISSVLFLFFSLQMWLSSSVGSVTGGDGEPHFTGLTCFFIPILLFGIFAPAIPRRWFVFKPRRAAIAPSVQCAKCGGALDGHAAAPCAYCGTERPAVSENDRARERMLKEGVSVGGQRWLMMNFGKMLVGTIYGVPIALFLLAILVKGVVSFVHRLFH